MWQRRYQEEGLDWLRDRSSRPHRCRGCVGSSPGRWKAITGAGRIWVRLAYTSTRSPRSRA
ncbi:leucine zipper domain-containing protein [Streptomyces sp. NBC_00444]